jgi:hypothetical protein
VKRNVAKKVSKRKRRVLKRLAKARTDRFVRGADSTCVIGANAIGYELSERVHAIGHGGIGMVMKLARKVGLINWTAPGSRSRETDLDGEARRKHRFLSVLNDLIVTSAMHPCYPRYLWLNAFVFLTRDHTDHTDFTDKVTAKASLEGGVTHPTWRCPIRCQLVFGAVEGILQRQAQPLGIAP